MMRARVAGAQLISTALGLQLEAAVCSNVIRAARQGEALRMCAQRQNRLLATAAAAQLGLPGLSQHLSVQQSLGLQWFRQFAAAAAAQQQPQQQQQQPKKEEGYDSLELTQERIDSITDKIPQRPVGVVEGTSYGLVIAAAFGVLIFVLYQVLSSLVFEPTALTAFNAALERLRADPRITVRIGGADDIRAWGANSDSRVARQQIPHQLYKDASGVEHVRIQFHIRGPSGTGLVNADMYRDASGQWQYTYLVVDAAPAPGYGGGGGPQRLTLVAPR